MDFNCPVVPSYDPLQTTGVEIYCLTTSGGTAGGADSLSNTVILVDTTVLIAQGLALEVPNVTVRPCVP